MLKTKELFERRRRRTRYQIRKLGAGKPRLSVHRTNKQIYAQVIDDLAGRTLAAASTLEQDLRAGNGGNAEARLRPWVSLSPSAPRQPVSSRSSSTAAVFGITDGFVRWRKPRVKPD